MARLEADVQNAINATDCILNSCQLFLSSHRIILPYCIAFLLYIELFQFPVLHLVNEEQERGLWRSREVS